MSKLVSATFDDDEIIDTATVVLPLDELVILYRLAGSLSPAAITAVTGDVRWGNALFDVASGLGDVLNRFFDDGANTVLRSFPVSVGPPS